MPFASRLVKLRRLSRLLSAADLIKQANQGCQDLRDDGAGGHNLL
jgi:hypothetical protein